MNCWCYLYTDCDDDDCVIVGDVKSEIDAEFDSKFVGEFDNNDGAVSDDYTVVAGAAAGANAGGEHIYTAT